MPLLATATKALVQVLLQVRCDGLARSSLPARSLSLLVMPPLPWLP